MIKLAVTDLDNTLIAVGNPGASSRARQAIHALLDAGVHVGPASGRVPAAMRWMFGGDEACYRTGAFVNGQLVYVDGTLVHEELLDAEELMRVGSLIERYEGCALVVYDLDARSDVADGVAYHMGATAEELARHVTCFGAHPRTISRLERPAYLKSNVRCDLPWPQMVQLRDDLRREFPAFDFVFPTLHGPFIDILPHGCSKGRAVMVIAERLGLSLDEVVVFGDSENDLSMFEVARHSVAVRNASDELVSAARHHIGSAAEDAVADAFLALAEAARAGGMPPFLAADDAS